jgi:alpha-galactosidase
MIEDYGADYVKMDYNVDAWFVDGDFEAERKAYLEWVDGLHTRFPNVFFETCSSGGMRMDYQTLKHFSAVSTSDQIYDWLYPYIAGNILSAVLPEQAAVWSYPVSGFNKPITAELAQKELSLEKIALNMINSMLGRTHLGSNLSLLSQEQFSLVQEGVAYIKQLNEMKRKAMPYFLIGFTDFSKDMVACGLQCGEKLYLAVWVLRGNQKAIVPLKEAKGVKLAYPSALATDFALIDGNLTVNFTQTNAARLFEIEL